MQSKRISTLEYWSVCLLTFIIAVIFNAEDTRIFLLNTMELKPFIISVAGNVFLFLAIVMVVLGLCARKRKDCWQS